MSKNALTTGERIMNLTPANRDICLRALAEAEAEQKAEEMATQLNAALDRVNLPKDGGARG